MNSFFIFSNMMEESTTVSSLKSKFFVIIILCIVISLIIIISIFLLITIKYRQPSSAIKQSLKLISKQSINSTTSSSMYLFFLFIIRNKIFDILFYF
jgi:cytoskeletal protein RodZ